jgi:hypothetical protein
MPVGGRAARRSLLRSQRKISINPYVQVKTGPKITEAEDFRGDEPPDANCQFLLEGEDLQGAEEGEPKRKSQAVKRASRHCKTRKRRDQAKWTETFFKLLNHRASESKWLRPGAI